MLSPVKNRQREVIDLCSSDSDEFPERKKVDNTNAIREVMDLPDDLVYETAEKNKTKKSISEMMQEIKKKQ